MQYQPSATLRNRTFCGLLVAQFLAAFNDQAIHASAMFYAINHHAMSEATAISLMPILFFAPWALFCTLAGYLADKYSKRTALVTWKIAEVGITLIALAGFWLGSGPMHAAAGPWIVLSTVFLMGTHSAFFVPAKYGAMPEILQPHLLSRGNGLLESLSFLAVILGTVTGGILSSEYVFKGQEYYIGMVLVALALIGAVASFLIQPMPAANPDRPFPTNLFKPLVQNVALLIRSRPLALAVLGIAFFTFVVAFMRATVYMLGESQIPRWSEFKTSIIVGMSALGIGLGSPLAGQLSGGKVELGLVPIGAVGMIVGCCLAAFLLQWLPGLILCIILVGFCTGFFIVPLFTLLQHRAPRTSKGDLIATSNFINVVGAICASVLFFVLVSLAHAAHLVPLAPQKDLFTGKLKTLEMDRHGRLAYVVVETAHGIKRLGARQQLDKVQEEDEEEVERIEVEDGDLINMFGRLGPGSAVTVSTYTLPPTERRPRELVYFRLRAADLPMKAAYDNEDLPRYLFLGAGLMTLGTLVLLCRQLPDFFVRALLWLRTQGRYRLRVVGVHHLPTDGPVILASNCDHFESCLQVVAATDRYTRFILLETPDTATPPPLLRYLARRTGLIPLQPGNTQPADWSKARSRAKATLAGGDLLGISLHPGDGAAEMLGLLHETQQAQPAPVLPVIYYVEDATARLQRVQVVFGPLLPSTATGDDILKAIAQLREQVQQDGLSAVLPAAAAASP